MDVKYNLSIHDTQTNNRERNVNTFKEYNLYKFCYMMFQPWSNIIFKMITYQIRFMK